MTIRDAQKKRCWNCDKPYDEVYANPTSPNQIVGHCHKCDSIHGLGYFKKREEA